VQPAAPGVLHQLRLAESLGVAVPRTVVTTDPAQAETLLEGSRFVVKALTGHFVEERAGELSGRFPVVAERGSLTPRVGPPVIVQEYVEHEAELRVYAVRDDVFAFEVAKTSPSDPWLAPDRVSVRQVDLPGTVAVAIKALMPALGLRYAAFDFLLRDGVPVFLEANADGDWRWIEERTGTSAVTGAVARMLVALHRSVIAVTATATAATSAGGGLDLMTFLGGRR
jgi:glutathione synthase/RimK-type ligase-like ATP-grasp enzyme